MVRSEGLGMAPLFCHCEGDFSQPKQSRWVERRKKNGVDAAVLIMKLSCPSTGLRRELSRTLTANELLNDLGRELKEKR